KNSREDILMKHLSAVAIAVLIGTAAFQFSNPVSGQSDGGWITLVDSTKMGDWDEVGKANWAMKDGALVADKLDGKDASYLVSKNSYKDRSEEHTSELQSLRHLVCRLLLEKK